MNITAKCCCGANVDIQPGRTGYGNNTSAQDEQRVMEVFEKWTEKHQGCSSLIAESQRPSLSSAPFFERFARDEPQVAPHDPAVVSETAQGAAPTDVTKGGNTQR